MFWQKKCFFINSFIHLYLQHCLKNQTGPDSRTDSTLIRYPFQFGQVSRTVLGVEPVKIGGNRSKIGQNQFGFFKTVFQFFIYFSFFIGFLVLFFLIFFYDFGILNKPKNKVFFFFLLNFITFAIVMLYFIDKMYIL